MLVAFESSLRRVGKRRRIFRAAGAWVGRSITGGSLALAIALTVFWLRNVSSSWKDCDQILFVDSAQRLWDLKIAQGTLCASIYHGWPGKPIGRWFWRGQVHGPYWSDIGMAVESHRFGFRTVRSFEEVALTEDGQAYVDSSQGELPLGPWLVNVHRDRWRVPRYYSAPLAIEIINLGPCVAWIIAFAMLPFAYALGALRPVVLRVYKSRRRRGGTCPTCGYDMRATPVRCPECGEIKANGNLKMTHRLCLNPLFRRKGGRCCARAHAASSLSSDARACASAAPNFGCA